MAYSSIVKPSVYFNTKLYTGDASSNRAITGVGFQPDFLWIKDRDASENHCLFDSVRGADKRLFSNSSDAESTLNSSNRLVSFDSNGFTIGLDGNVNGNADKYVAWNWLGANGTASNSNGSITSTVSVNTTAGFSIVGWTGNAVTGATIGHGLGVKPNMIILKNRGPDGASWQVYHSSLGATKYLQLNSTGAVTTSNTRWYDTEPTSTVFTTGSSGDVKGDNSGETFIAYCFAEKTGYSKFGSYTGNGNADGTFVYTGFKPAWVMIKNTQQGSDDWQIFDNKRANTFNPADKILQANLSNAEGTSAIDLLSNGFKIRASSGFMNNNGESMIYMCFAEAPLVANSGANGVPATAR